MPSLFKMIKKLANDYGISINELEEQVGLKKNVIYSWNKSVPNISNVLKVANFFNVSIDYLLGRDDQLFSYDLQNLLIGNLNNITYKGKLLTEEEKKRLKLALKIVLMNDEE